MTISVYCGLMGSGKSFEVVSSVILPAILAGRRVITNVDGISQDKIYEYLKKKYKNSDPDKYGTIVHIRNDQITEPAFFYDEHKPEIQTIVQGGDLVAIDEAWRFWGTDCGKLSHEHMQFFRMHRHYVHPDTAVTCDVVLMTQDLSGLHRSLRNVVEFTYKMHKHKSLGFSTRYRVAVYEGYQLNKKTLVTTQQKKYDKAIFPLYQSYAGGKGAELTVDKRQNIFNNPTLWIYVVLMIILGIVSAYFVYRFFHQKVDAKLHSPASTTPQAITSSPNATATKPAIPKTTSDIWRIVGAYQVGNDAWVVISDGLGHLRTESPSVFYATGAAQTGKVDGLNVTRWSGQDISNSDSHAPQSVISQ